VGGGGGGEREARKGGEELREGARGSEAENGEAGVGLQDVVERGARREERAEELPRVGGGVGVEGGGAPSGRRRRRRSDLHGGGDGASHQLACVMLALFIWLIIRFIQLIFSAGTVFFSHKKSASSVFQPAYNSSRTGPLFDYEI
jgi:hypothetical protein